MKVNKKLLILTTLLTLTPIIFGLFNWHALPEQIPTHWNFNNEVDGYSSKTMVVFGLPVLLAFINCICVFAYKADPKKENYSSKMINLSLWLVPIISLVVNTMIYSSALGNAVDAGKVAGLLLSVMFIFTGNYMPKVKQNYTMGIKLPWTLNSEDNWYKTHRLAGIIWTIAGFSTLICGFLELYAVTVIIILLAVLIPVIYSYAIYKEEKSEDKE